MASAVATEAACGVGITALGLFNYNRGNFQYDADLRFERFTAGREFALEQAEQYRSDLRALSALTQKKNTMYSIMASLCMALCVALYCAGRLGLHGPSPPAWIMGLWYTNNAAAFSFMALGIWLAVHASSRAQAASVHLLTRKARLPVPTLQQLDEARRFGSEFEQQAWGDVFRVPYLAGSGAPREPPARGAPRARSAPAGARRAAASSWVREELEARRAAPGAPAAPPRAAPEHFRLYAAVQAEWFAWDAYARVCVLYGWLSFVHALGYYGLGHINIELRAFWVAYATGFVLMVLHALLLRFDIVPGRAGRKETLPRCQWLGPLAWLPAAIAMSLDFRVQFSYTAVVVCWVLIFVAYLMQLIYTLRLLEIVLPDDWRAPMRPQERIGAAWWPESWRIPSTFQHVLYLVAPPQFLQPGQHDIVRETHEGTSHDEEDVGPTITAVTTSATAAGAEHGMQSHDAPHTGATEGKQTSSVDGKSHSKILPPFTQTRYIEPWRLVTSIVLALCFAWAFLIVCCIVDVVLGEQALVTAPHWSRPPMTRQSLEPHELGTPYGFPWAAGAKPFLPEQMAWHEEKRRAEMETLGARRLSAHHHQGLQILGDHGKVSSALTDLMLVLTRGSTADPVGIPEAISWPAFFEPQLLACGPATEGKGSLVVALTPRGFGAAVHIARDPGASIAGAFKLAGITHLPPLLGASWVPASSGDGLLLVTQLGHILTCPGPRPQTGGTWWCQPPAGLPQRLPVADGANRLAAATAAWLPGVDGARRLHVALVQSAAPDLVAIYEHSEGEAEEWLPLGEVPISQAMEPSRVSLAFTRAGELIVATDRSTVVQHLPSGAVVASGVAAPEDSWRSSCVLENGAGHRVARLHLRANGGPITRRPELITAELNRGSFSALEKSESEAAFYQ